MITGSSIRSGLDLFPEQCSQDVVKEGDKWRCERCQGWVEEVSPGVFQRQVWLVCKRQQPPFR